MGNLYGYLMDMEGKSFEIPAIFKFTPGNFQTTAEINGYYSINIPDGDYEVVISYGGSDALPSGEKRYGIQTIIQNIVVNGNTNIDFISKRLDVGIHSYNIWMSTIATEGEDIYIFFVPFVREFNLEICLKIVDIDTKEILSYGCSKNMAVNSHIFNMLNRPLFLRLMLEETENGDFCSVDLPIIEYSTNRTNRNIFAKLNNFQHQTGSYINELVDQTYDFEFETIDLGLIGLRIINLLNEEIIFDDKQLSFISYPGGVWFDESTLSIYDHIFLRIQTYHNLWYGTKEEIIDEEYDLIIRNNELAPPENWPPMP